MTIPFGRRRLVISLVTPRPEALEFPAAFGATDQELVRLSRSVDPRSVRELWELQGALFGVGRR